MKLIYILKKSLFLILIWCLILIPSINLFSQSGIILKKFDITSYPKVINDIYIFDANQDFPVQNYNTSNFAVLDNGIVPMNVNLVNQSQTPLNNLSVNIVFDLGLDANEPVLRTRFQTGKELSRSFITLFDSTKHEVALSSFDAINYLNQNFTYSKTKLISSLNLISPEATSLMDEAFLDKPGGTIEVHQSSKFDKVTLLITDGSGLINKNQIITDLIQKNIKVFIVMVGKPISIDLQDAAIKSGGYFVDNLNENSDLQLIAKYIYALMLGYKPSIISYENTFSCNDVHDVEINLPGKGYQVKYNYNVQSLKKPIIVSNPKALGFSSVLPGKTKDLDILLTAVNSDITISKFYIQDPRFSIVAGDITQDLIIQENNSHKLTIRYSPTDSAITFTTLQIASTACLGNEIYLTGGFPNTPPVDRTIKLMTPACNQTLIPGDTFSIVWTGLLPQDVIQLEYSTDNGKSWDTLARNLTDLSYKWTVPNIQSDQCLVRAIQLWPNNVGRTLDLKHQAEVNTAFFNNDGSLVITASSDHTAGIWNANSGKILFWLKGHDDAVNYGVFNRTGDRVATVGEDGKLIIWDVATGKEVSRKILLNKPNSVNYSPDNTKLVVATNSGYAYVFDTTGLKDIAAIPAHTKFGVCSYAEFSPDGHKILTSGNEATAKVFEWETDISKPTEEYKINNAGIAQHHATFNYNATKIALTSLITKYVYVFDCNTRDTIYTIEHDAKNNVVINTSRFNVDSKYGERILTAAQDNVRLWDGNTGLPANPHIIQEHTESVRTATFNFDSKRILTASWDYTAKIWNLEQRDLQMDTTDCTFRIMPLKLEMTNIDFPPVPINDSKDSTINEFIINKSDFNFEIRDLKLAGNSNGDFQIIKSDEIPFVLDTLSPSKITVLFRPTKPGFITDTITIVTGGGKFSAILTGTGIDKGLFAFTNLIDFGQIELGDSKDSVISMLVINKSFSDIQINSNSIQKPDTLHFSLVNDISKTVLKPNETVGITLRYTPSALEVNNGTLSIEHNGNLSPLKVSLLGEGITPRVDTLTLVAGDISGEPGEIVEMPIYLKNLSGAGLRYSITGFETNLRFNSSLLMPLDFYPSYTDGNDRVMQLKLPVQFGPDSILTKLKFKVALGNDTTSSMTLEYTAQVGLGKLLINEKSGLFTLKGYCKEATPRLFDDDGRVFLNQSLPNPATNSFSLDYSIIETDYTKLYIVDISGKIVKTILDEIVQKGKYNVKIDVSDLPAGLYNYILETPTRKFTRNLIIQR